MDETPFRSWVRDRGLRTRTGEAAPDPGKKKMTVDTLWGSGASPRKGRDAETGRSGSTGTVQLRDRVIARGTSQPTPDADLLEKKPHQAEWLNSAGEGWAERPCVQ
jgi:hypothetical protein